MSILKDGSDGACVCKVCGCIFTYKPADVVWPRNKPEVGCPQCKGLNKYKKAPTKRV